MSNLILVVEDNEDISLLIKLLLESIGYQVKVVDNGKDALKQVEKVQPKLILMDIMMAKISGLQVCRKIKEKLAYQDLPILLISAIDCLKEEQLSKSKANGIIYKPFDLDYLASKVVQLAATS